MINKKVLVIIEEIENINTSGAIVNWNLCKILAPEFQFFDILTLDTINPELEKSWEFGKVYLHPKNNLNSLQKIILKIPKFRAVVQIFLGNDFFHYNRIKNIRKFLNSKLNSYDEIILLSGGTGFTPHFAINKKRYSSIKKTGIYHDPYPGSCYPKPYKTSNSFFDFMKKIQLQKSFKTVDNIVFPSQRLHEWFLKSYTIDSSKVKIIPHAVNFDAELKKNTNKNPNSIMITHAGTLLKPRNPLIFLEILSGLNISAKLELYGSIEKSVYSHIQKFNGGSILIENKRIEYSLALSKLMNSDFLLIIESEGKYNPFLPTKFVDYLNMNLPIIALTSNNSEVSRLLGDDYPFKCELNDRVLIQSILKTKIWDENLTTKALQKLNSLKVVFSKENIRNNYFEILN